MKQLEIAGGSPRHARHLPGHLQFASVSSALKEKSQTGRKTPVEQPVQPVSLILLDRPTRKKAPRSASTLARKSKRPTTTKDSPAPLPPANRSHCHSAERDQRTHIEVNLDRAVLELSEIKAEYHLEKTELSRQMMAMDKKPTLAPRKDSEEISVKSDIPPSIREKKLSEKLGLAETAMRLLFEKNQELEQQLKSRPLPHQQCIEQTSALQTEVARLTHTAKDCEGRLAALWESRMQQFRDPASDYTETRIRHSLKDAKRYLGYYWALRELTQSVGPDTTAALRAISELEKTVRDEDRKEYEQRLGQCEQFNCDMYVKNQLLKRTLP